jgi:hypothetical protein
MHKRNPKWLQAQALLANLPAPTVTELVRLVPFSELPEPVRRRILRLARRYGRGAFFVRRRKR